MDEQPPDAEEQEAYQRAISDGRFADALSAASVGLLQQLLAMLQADGITITGPDKQLRAIELFGGLAATLKAHMVTHPDQVTYRLKIGEEMAGALAQLQLTMERGISEGQKGTDALAELIMQGMRVGAIAEHLGLTLAGHFDEFIRMALDEDRVKTRQREAAERTNAKKGTAKKQALDEAGRITTINPTLSNEDLAVKVRESTALATTVKTVTGWVREWRRDGLLPAQKKPGR